MNVISPIKRERIKKAELLEKKTALRAALPVLTREEIRRHRLNYHEALLEDLMEQGFDSSAEFLRQLFDYQAENKAEHINDTIIQGQPNLFEAREELDKLFVALRCAEGAHFGDIDEGRAITHLIKSREMSIGHLWSACRELSMRQKTIFVEVCFLIYKLMIKEIKKLLKYDPVTGLRLCALAKKRAEEACIGKAEILLLQGLCEMGSMKSQAATESFLKALLLYQSEKNIESICEARMNLALAFLQMGNWKETSIHLEKLLAFAEENNVPTYVGQAYLYLGEYNLNNGNPKLASPLLVQALNIFHEIDDVERREQVKNLAAVSKGQEIIKQYVSLIISCGPTDRTGREQLIKLVNWKDIREQFWSDFSGTKINDGVDDDIDEDDEYEDDTDIIQEVVYVENLENLPETGTVESGTSINVDGDLSKDSIIDNMTVDESIGESQTADNIVVVKKSSLKTKSSNPISVKSKISNPITEKSEP